MKITDYHDFSHPDTLKEKRRKLDIGDIYINGAECGECDYFVRSRNRHDYVECKCGNIAVDGGSWYAKRVFKTTNFKDVIVQFNDDPIRGVCKTCNGEGTCPMDKADNCTSCDGIGEIND